MYTMFSFVLLVAIVLYVGHANDKEYSRYSEGEGDKQWLLMLHIRQDLKLIASLLMGLLLMTGVAIDHPEAKSLQSLLHSLGLE